jgi:hypothetical protein
VVIEELEKEVILRQFTIEKAVGSSSNDAAITVV